MMIFGWNMFIFFMFLLIFLRFLLIIMNYANLMIYISDHKKKGMCLKLKFDTKFSALG